MHKFSLRVTAVLVVLALVTGMWLGHGYAAGSALEPGSAQDPLVTRSYVDQEIEKLRSSIGSGSGGDVPAAGLLVVTVPAGKKITGYEGTEFILRSGKGKVVASAAGGLSDLTDGTNLAANVLVPKDHLVLFPRSDGRGFQAVTEIIVVVRGRHSVEP